MAVVVRHTMRLGVGYALYVLFFSETVGVVVVVTVVVALMVIALVVVVMVLIVLTLMLMLMLTLICDAAFARCGVRRRSLVHVLDQPPPPHRINADDDDLPLPSDGLGVARLA